MSSVGLPARAPFLGPSPIDEILAFRQIHPGQTCLILGNGPSANLVKGVEIDIPVIATNRAWKLRQWDYDVIGDTSQFPEVKETLGNLTELDPLFTFEDGPEHAVRLKQLKSERREISWNLTKGVYPNNTVVMTAIQLAMWMGFELILLLGVDGYGPHFDDLDGPEVPQAKFANQREAFGYLQGKLEALSNWRHVEFRNLSPDTKVRAFEKGNFHARFRSKRAPIESGSGT